MKKQYLTTTAAIGFVLFLVGCSGSSDQQNSNVPESPEIRRKFGFGSLLGDEGLTFTTKSIRGRTKNEDVGMRVNSYLWQASLATLDFMPLISSDAVGGVLITDWHPVNNNPNEQVKVMVRVKSCELSADSLSVSIHKRYYQRNGVWLTKEIAPAVNTQLEMLILERARDLRTQHASSCN